MFVVISFILARSTPTVFVATKNPRVSLSTLDIPRDYARWVLSNHFHGNESFELPIKYDIQENHIRLDDSGTLLL